MKIAIDLMGGEGCGEQNLEGCLAYPYPEELIVIGDLARLDQQKINSLVERGTQLRPCAAALTGNESPRAVLKRSHDTSLAIGMQMLADRKTDALVSSADTKRILPKSPAKEPTSKLSIQVPEPSRLRLCAPHVTSQISKKSYLPISTLSPSHCCSLSLTTTPKLFASALACLQPLLPPTPQPPRCLPLPEAAKHEVRLADKSCKLEAQWQRM